MDKVTIYVCQGRHFKAYDNDQKKVLEHPNDSEEVHLEFCIDSDYLYVFVTEHIETDMRISGQKKRVDIYIIQYVFKPLLEILKNNLVKKNVKAMPQMKWRYGNPVARNGRQGVPSLTKLAEIISIDGAFPIGNKFITFSNATAVIDSEIPGDQQSKWKREGGSRQIHIGIFGGTWNSVNRDKQKEIVIVKIPLKHIENNFIKTIESNWIN